MSADVQIDSQAVSGIQLNPQASSDTQGSYQLNEHFPFSDVYPSSPSNVLPPQNTANSMIYSPTYACSMPPSHVYPPSNGYGYSFPSRYTHQPSIGYSPTSSYVFPPPTNPYLYPSPSGNPYPPLYNAYSPQYSHVSPSSSLSNSGTCHVPHNTSVIPSSDSEDPPVFTLLRLTAKKKKCYGCGNNLRRDSSNAAKPPYDMMVRYILQRS